MAVNFTELESTVTGLFDILGLVITEVVELITGDLMVLAIAGAIVGLIIAIIVAVIRYVRGVTKNSVNSTKMK